MQRLVRAYSPIVMLRAQEDPPRNTAEEQYEPTTVDTVLGNPRVKLVREGRAGPRQVARAPTASDIAGLGSDYHLDLPGNPLEPGCTYARAFAAIRKAGRAPPVAYAHVAKQAGHSGFVAQYWFFDYFNQFNDLHESDSEGMQIVFDAASAEEALASGPTQIVLFQHSGGEKADWDDDKVEKEGTHPVVCPAAGSHATFYESAIFVENGQGGSGLGCDNTSRPVRRVAVQPGLVPTAPRRGSADQWLTYDGRWGQKEKGYNNGPTGPNTKAIRAAFRGSSTVVRGGWWRTLRVAGFFWLISVIAGPVLGFVLIFADVSLTWVNVVGSVVFALVGPYVAIGGTFLYLDLSARERKAVRPGGWRLRRWLRTRTTGVERPSESG